MFFWKLILASMAMTGMSDDGWVKLEKKALVEDVVTDIDPSIWVLFTKKVGSKKISVRVPEEPSYSLLDGSFFLLSERQGETFELWIQEKSAAREVGEELFELDGRYVHERIMDLGDHTITLRVISPLPNVVNAETFFNSFAVFS